VSELFFKPWEGVGGTRRDEGRAREEMGDCKDFFMAVRARKRR